jgi:hypothetical protein
MGAEIHENVTPSDFAQSRFGQAHNNSPKTRAFKLDNTSTTGSLVATADPTAEFSAVQIKQAGYFAMANTLPP